MAILGLSAGFHDAGATLISNQGKVLFAGHAERYSGIKNDANLNDALIEDVTLVIVISNVVPSP